MNNAIFIVISIYVMIIVNLIPINIMAFENAYQYKWILVALNIVIFSLLTIMGYMAMNSSKNENYKLENKKNKLNEKPNIIYNTTVNYNGEDQINKRNIYLKDKDNYKGLDRWV